MFILCTATLNTFIIVMSHISLASLLQRTSMNIIIVAAASIPVAFVVVSAAATDGGMAKLEITSNYISTI